MTGVQVIGREAERARVDRWLACDWPATLLIEGVAGIGKSTLWGYALERASAAGSRVLSWRASIAERDLAFAVLTALFDDAADVDVLGGLHPARRRALETALGRRDPDGEPPSPGLVGLAVADLLEVVANRPVLVGVDDVQWADRASEEVLGFAARRLRAVPVGLVLARRTAGWSPDPAAGPDSPLAVAVERLERIEVGPLSVGALGRLLHERLDVVHPRPLLVRMHEACGGNSLLALEISRSLLARTVRLVPGEPFPVPPQAGPLVRDHLAALSRAARRAVVLVAMAPDPRLALVERVLGTGGDAAVDEACTAGILVADGGRLRAGHPLFTSTAYADTPPGERRQLRRALAGLSDDPVERAVHLAAIVDGPDVEAAAALAEAGRLAYARGAPAIAADLLDRAAEASGRDEDRAVMLTQAADAAAAAGDADRAEARLRSALALVPAGRQRAEALLALGDVVYIERPNEALPLLRSALSHTGGDPLLTATVHSYIAGLADMDLAAACRSAHAAVQILRRPDVIADPIHLACALLERALAMLLLGQPPDASDFEDGLRLLDEAGEAGSTGRDWFPARAHAVADRCLNHLGRLQEARVRSEAEYRRRAARGQYGLLPPMAQVLSSLTLLCGDWPAARRYAAECGDLVAQGEQSWRERALLAQSRILAHDGDLSGARAIAVPALDRQEAAGDRWEAAIFCAVLGFTELSVPDAPAALRYLRRALDHADALEMVLPTQFRFLGDLVEAAVLAGEVELARQVLAQRLEGSAARLPLPWTLAMASRCRGLLRGAEGDPAEAVDWFDRAIGVFDGTLTMPFERARTLYLRGQAHRRAGHRRSARADLAEARTVFDTLGAGAWLARATQELGRLGGRAPSGSTLTAAELAVAELATTGRSNREIAAELGVSVRTIESQLATVYRKLEVHSRGQLAAALPAGADPAAAPRVNPAAGHGNIRPATRSRANRRTGEPPGRRA
jgi:DNA-binding CsgD family transcriptional regulator